MAEAIAVVGLISAISQLGELGIKLVKRLDDFASAADTAPEFVNSIRIRLVLLRRALQNIRDQADNGHIDVETAQSLRDVVSSTVTRVQALATLLDKAAPLGTFSTFEKRIKAVKSLGYDRKIQKIVVELQGDVQLLTFCLVSGRGAQGAQPVPQQRIQEIEGNLAAVQLDQGASSDKGLLQLDSGELQTSASPRHDQCTYTVQNGTIKANTSFNASDYDGFARVVRQQIKSSLPHAIAEAIKQIEPKYRPWFANQIPTVQATVEEALHDFGRTDVNTSYHHLDSDSHDEFLDVNCPSEDVSNVHQEFGSEAVHPSHLSNNDQMEEVDGQSRESSFEIPMQQLRKATKPTKTRRKRMAFRWIFGSLIVTVTRSLDENSPSKHPFYELSLTFSCAPNLLKRGIFLTYNQSSDYRGFPIISPSIETFAIVPDESLIFRYARIGDLEGLRSLFLQGAASPSDQSSEGYTALHCATIWGHEAVLRNLLAEGVRCVAHESLTYCVLVSSLRESAAPQKEAEAGDRLKRYMNICRLLELDGYELNYSVTDMINWCYHSINLQATVSTEDYQAFAREWFSFAKDNLYFESDNELAIPLLSWIYAAILQADVLTLEVLLEDGGVNLNIWIPGYAPMQAWLHRVIDLYVEYSVDKPKYSDDTLRAVLVLLLKAGCDPHGIDEDGNEPYDQASLHDKKSVWFEALVSAGIDLDRYLAIVDGEFAESTAIEDLTVSKDDLSLRRRFTFDED